MLKQIPEEQWVKAGAETRDLIMGRAFPRTKQSVAARTLGFSESTLSRVMQGKMALSEQFAEFAERALVERARSGAVPDFTYTPGEITSIWFQPTDEGGQRSKDAGRKWAAIALLTVFGATGLVGTWLLRTPPQGEVSTSLSSCLIAPMELPPELVDRYRSWSERMAQEYIKARTRYVDLCPVETVQEHNSGGLLIQRMEDADGRQMILLAADQANAIGLNRVQWISFIETQQLLSPTKTPVPLRFKVGGPGSRIAMSDGSEMVAPEPDQRHVLVESPVIDAWIEQGGAEGPFGWPMSHGYIENGRLRSDFNGGYFIVEHFDAEAPVVTPVPDRSIGLSTENLPRLLALPDGSTWLVDNEGERRWVMDAATNSCLRRTLEAPELISGEGLSRFPLGEPALCG